MCKKICFFYRWTILFVNNSSKKFMCARAWWNNKYIKWILGSSFSNSTRIVRTLLELFNWHIACGRSKWWHKPNPGTVNLAGHMPRAQALRRNLYALTGLMTQWVPRATTWKIDAGVLTLFLQGFRPQGEGVQANSCSVISRKSSSVMLTLFFLKIITMLKWIMRIIASGHWKSTYHEQWAITTVEFYCMVFLAPSQHGT